MGVRMIAAATALLLLTACGSPGGNSESETTPSASIFATGSPPATTTESTPPPPATPHYRIILPSPKRKDGKPNYFVVIDPVDLSSDSFKRDVKLVVQSIAKTTTSGPDFSARIFDDEAVAAAYLSQETDPSLGQSRDEISEYLDERGQHLVATYQGGLQIGEWKYHIAWYPGAFTDTPNVGPYVSSEEWKP
jgi:hypothetical protein